MTKETTKSVATRAAKALQTSSSPAVRTVAASVLTQTKSPSEATSRRVASAASKILSDDRYGSAAKSIAGSALSQKGRK
ncbi:hypothetical protein GCM10009078_36920 [Cupriavidus gilardii]|nr:hypothetical protein F7Q96_20550 [Cupriavidus gilardii]